MSYVTTAIVLVSYYEPDENVKAACEPWDPERPGDRFADLTAWEPKVASPGMFWGGTKAPESDVLAAALNYATIEDIEAHLARTLKHPYVLCHSTEGQDEQWALEPSA